MMSARPALRLLRDARNDIEERIADANPQGPRALDVSAQAQVINQSASISEAAALPCSSDAAQDASQIGDGAAGEEYQYPAGERHGGEGPGTVERDAGFE